MPDKVDMSLDEIVKQNKGGRGGTTRGGGGNRGGFRGGRGFQRRSLGSNGGGGIRKRRSGPPLKSPLSRPRVPEGKWSHDLYNQGRATRRSLSTSGSALSTSAKITISNLDFGVSDQDIKDLFEEFGTIKKAAVHYDRSGRSLGTADVVFEKKADALKAIKKYNGVQLDGRPMNIELANSNGGNQQRSQSAGPRNGSTASFARRGRRGGARGGGQQRQQQKQTKTQEELDAELDSYAQKMQTD